MAFSLSVGKTRNLEGEHLHCTKRSAVQVCREGTNFANFSERIHANSSIRAIHVEKNRL
jgi:hypothetical protein